MAHHFPYARFVRLQGDGTATEPTLPNQPIGHWVASVPRWTQEAPRYIIRVYESPRNRCWISPNPLPWPPPEGNESAVALVFLDATSPGIPSFSRPVDAVDRSVINLALERAGRSYPRSVLYEAPIDGSTSNDDEQAAPDQPPTWGDE